MPKTSVNYPGEGNGLALREPAVPNSVLAPHEYRLACAESGLDAFVVIDSVAGGQAMGGIRMTPTVGPDLVQRLAREMSLKLALAGVPIGGAKAGIRSGTNDPDERQGQLQAFGRVTSLLLHGGVYLGTDQGVGFEDRATIFRAARYDVDQRFNGALPCTWGQLWERVWDITGYAVVEAALATALDVRLRVGRPLRVSIHGFGVVGRGAARAIVAAGHRVVAVADEWGTVHSDRGLSVESLVAVTDARGRIVREGLPAGIASTDPVTALSAPCDLLLLASGSDVLDATDAGEVTAALVVEGANLPCTSAALDVLRRRGVEVIPGAVANSGAASVTGMALTGMLPRFTCVGNLAEWLFAEIGRRVRANALEVSRHARATGFPPHHSAELFADWRRSQAEVTAQAAPQLHRKDP